MIPKKDKANRIKIEVEFPKVTYYNIGVSLIERIAKSRIATLFERVCMFSMPVITGLALFLMIGSIVVLLSDSTIRDASKSIEPEAYQIGPANPYIPWNNPLSIGALAFLSSIFISQFGRGIIARKYGIKLESWGVDTILGLIPINFSLNLDKEEVARLPLKRKSAIWTVDPLSNFVLAGISLLFLLLITSTLIVIDPLDPSLYGLVITKVNPGSLAESIGLVNGDIIQQIQGKVVRNPLELNKNLNDSLGKSVTIDIVDTNKSNQKILVTLPSEREPGKGILGVSIAPVQDPKEVLDRYNSMIVTNPLQLLVPPTFVQVMVPFSDLNAGKYTSPIFKEHYEVFANFFFWIWFINFNIGLIESLPINHLPAGKLYNSLIEHKLRNKPRWISRCLTIVLSVMMIVLWLYNYYLSL